MNSKLKFDFAVNKENNTIVVKREFAGDLELVWKAWTTAEILDQWWAPEPCKAETKTMDFREGGHWLYCMIMPPENKKNWGRQNYEKIVVHKKFSGTDVFCDENGIANPESPTGRFENVFNEEDGKTLVTITSTHNSFEEIEMVIEMGFKEGLASSFENLDKYLSLKNNMKMKRETLKSIGAVIAGFALLVILSIITDSILEKTGIMKTDPFVDNPVWLIAIIILYRTIFNTAGCYLTARLAPNKPMKHAIILGTIGAVLTIAGLIAMWDTPPHWYPISLIVLTLPAAWFGGQMAIKKEIEQSRPAIRH